jgi:hypothetical protein
MTPGSLLLLLLLFGLPTLLQVLQYRALGALKPRLDRLGPEVSGQWLYSPPAMGAFTPRVSMRLTGQMMTGELSPELSRDPVIVSLIWRVRIAAWLQIAFFVTLFAWALLRGKGG